MRLFVLFSFMLISIFSFAQIEIVEDFEGQTTAPDGWTADAFYFFQAQEGCNQSTSMVITMSPWGAPTVEATTPYYTGISNGTDLSINYDVKVAIFSFWGGETPVEDGWGSIDVEYTTDGDNWILLETIDDSNFTSTLSCETRSHSVEAADVPDGVDFQMRLTLNYLEGEYNVTFDNFSVTQEASTIPNCDATLKEPVNGATNIELDASINWNNATGLATGYKISVGTTSGGTDIADNVDLGNATSYTPGAPLEYTTVYYVNIQPYNAFGDAIDCTEQSFTTRNPPPPGSTCDNALVISDFPYNDSNTNEGFDNDYSTGPCDNYWIIVGDEVVYEITPTEEISINVRFDSLVGVQTAIQVLDGCPDVATTCMASYGSYTPQEQYFENLILEADHTYYIIVSSTGENNYFNYHLEVTQNPCVIPSADFLNVEDCDNNQYYVDVDITRMGSAESLTIADDQGNDAQQVTELGIATFGPYLTGTPVNFTITNDQDDYCVITGYSEFHCNDFCSSPYAINVNPDPTCAEYTSGSLIAATPPTENYSWCEGIVKKDVWFSFEATSTLHTIELTNVVAVVGDWASVRMEVMEGSCGDLTSLLCSNSTFNIIGNLNIGETYLIRVFDESETTAASFDICVATPPASPDNDICAMAFDLPVSSTDTCDNIVFGTTLSALPSPENTCYGTSNDVWYAFSPASTGYYEINLAVLTGNEWSTSMSYWTGDDCGSLSQSSDCNERPVMNVYAVAGETSYIMVRTNQGELGVEFSLCAKRVFPPSNNSCETPVQFYESTDASGNNIVIENNEGATNTYGTCFSNIYEDLWYTFTANYTGEYIFKLNILEGGYMYFAFYEDDCDNFVLAGGTFGCYNGDGQVLNVVAGTTYKVAIHGPDPATYEFFVYPANLPPANDNCATAEVLTESTPGMCENMISGNTYSSSNTSGSDCGAGNYDVWYNFTPANTGYYQFDLTQTAGSATSGITLYNGDCGALVQESVNCESTSMIENLEAGVNYILVVTSDSEGGTAAGVEFNLCAYQVTPPANNECADAIAFDESADDSGENTVSGTNELATYSPEACYETTFTGVWYTFTAAYSGEYTVNFTGLTGAASYAVYSGTCEAFEALNEDCYTTEASAFYAEAGNTYTISVQAEEASTFEFFVYPSLITPDNNDCFNAESFAESVDSTGNNMVTGTNEGALNSPEACYDESFQGVWYTFTPEFTGTYVLDFTGLTGDASYTVYSGDCEGLEYAEGISDCYNTDNTSIMVEAGIPYIVSVHSETAATYEFFAYPSEIVGTEELTFTKGLKYFPNPVSNDHLNITADFEMSNITVFNTLGQQVITETPESMNHIVNMAHLQAGIYFVKITIDGAEQTVKVIKE